MNSDKCLHRQRNGKSAVHATIVDRQKSSICMLCQELDVVPAPSPYSTYVYGRDVITQWKANTDLSAFTELRPRLFYRSNWRILHIDGFEPGYGNRTVHFDFKMQPVYAR